MRIAGLVLVVAGAVLQFPAPAQESASATPQCVTDPAQVTDENCYKPPMSQLLPFLMRVGRHQITTSVHIAYDEKGYVTSATLNRSTRDKAFDAAIVEWAKLMKLMPGAAGEGDLPLDFSVDR